MSQSKADEHKGSEDKENDATRSSANEKTTVKDPSPPKDRFSNIAQAISLIVVIPGFVGWILKALDFSDKNISIISIILSLIIAMSYYKRFINQKIPSTPILSVSFVLFGVLFFLFDSLSFKNAGLNKYYNTSDKILPEVISSISNSKKSVWMIGANFHTSMPSLKRIIPKKIKSGVSFYILMFNPNSKNLPMISNEFDQGEDQFKSECDATVSAILNLKSEIEKNITPDDKPGSLELRVYNETPRMRAYFIDPDDDGVSYIVPYINHADSVTLPGYQFVNSKGGAFDAYYQAAIRFWNHSQVYDGILHKK